MSRPLRACLGAAPGVLGLLLLGSPGAVHARSMDPALARLVVDPSCTLPDALAPCTPDRPAYYKLVNQWGSALAPHSAYEARTTGLSGLTLSLSGAFTGIDSQADYWRRGTRGSEDQAVDGVVGENSDPSGVLSVYSFEVRKGLGFGIEASGSIGLMPDTTIVTWGADLRVALLEGLRQGGWRYLPDTSLGVGLRRAAGMSDLDLGVLALDARVSEPFIGSSGFIVTPWVGYQFMRIDATSSWVDLTPNRDALAECGYVGPNVPGTSEAVAPEEGDAAANPAAAEPASGAPAGVFDGSPVCNGGSGADFASNASFGEAEIWRHRLLVGLSYRKELLRVGAELITDLVPADAAQPDAAVETALRCDASGTDCQDSPRQWTVVVQVGAAF
ncbi:MAG TPA: hypothetical protein VJU61_09650 [Polyangiaceae bacterium]|nr:hypothetical protein [Polyangiaceae bacterium]